MTARTKNATCEPYDVGDLASEPNEATQETFEIVAALICCLFETVRRGKAAVRIDGTVIVMKAGE